ncbi:MAG: PAS domain-containing protein [Bacteroidales bacterium]
MYVPGQDQILNDSLLAKGLTDANAENILTQAGLLLYFIHHPTQRWEGKGNFQKLTGEDAEAFKYFTLELFIKRIHPEDRDNFLTIHNEARTRHTSYSVKYRFLKKDGSYIFLSDNGCYYVTEAGHPYAVGILSDIVF